MLGGEITIEFFIVKNVSTSMLIQLERRFHISPGTFRRIFIRLNHAKEER